MTAVATRVPCPVEGCTYAADNGASIPAHVSMAHPDLPIATVPPKRPATGESFVETRIGAEQGGVKPRRSARNGTTSAAAPEPEPEGSAPRSAGATSGTASAAGGPELREIPLDLVDVGANVRISIEDLEELTASIAEHGVLQPVKVSPAADGRYLLLWGQRRTLAARQAGLTTIPAIVVDAPAEGPQRSVEQLVENLHRADLPALDRARAIRDVVATGMSQADLARKLGIAPSTVANDLGLLEAPASVQELLERGQLTPAHAKAMKGLAPKTQVELAKEAVERGYSAHRTEQEVQERKRRADLELERRKADHAALEARREVVDAGIAEQVAKAVDLDVVVIVAASSSYYQADTSSAWLIERLKAGGFTNARKAADWRETDPRPGGGVCDCKAFHAKVTETTRYEDRQRLVTYSLRWSNACVEPKHRQAKERASEQKRLAKEAVATRVQQHVRRTAAAWAIPEGRAIAVDRILAEAALWGLLSYRIPTWAEAHGGKKANPFAAIHALSDEELAKELAQEIASDFRDKAGYHVDWPALAAELELEATS